MTASRLGPRVLFVVSLTILGLVAPPAQVALGANTQQFLISPTGLDFGPVQVGTTSPQQTVAITNIGTASIVMSGAGGAPGGDFNGVQDCQGKTLAAGDSCHMFFTFTPSAGGPASATSSGTWNGQAFSIPLTGKGVAPQFRISPTALDFGPVQVGTTSPQQTVTITNVGLSPIVMSGAGGAPGGDFNGVQDCQGQTLAVGASCHMFFTFTPSATGSATASSSGTWNGQAFNIPLSGTGVAPQFRITPTALDFGPVQVGTISPQQTVTITNVGPSSVVMNGAGGAPGGDFNGVQDCQGVTLAVGASCHIFYKFEPQTAGAASANSIGTWNGQAFNIALAGNGLTDIGTNTQQLLISPTALDFGPVQVGTTSPQQTVTITNISTASIVMSGAGGAPANTDFNGVQDCQGKTLAAGDSCHMFFTYTPSSAGPASSASIGNWNGQAFNIPLTGTGVAPHFMISGAALDFGPVQVGATSPQQTVTITNVGLSSVVMSGAGGAPPNTDFNGVQDCQGQTLAVGASCHMFFTFTPSAAGSASSTSSGTWNGQAFNIPLSGTGVAPQFRITPTALDFGPVQVGATSPQQTVTITNVGLSSVVMSGAGGAPPNTDFNGVQDCQGQTLAAGASCHMSFTFTPSAAGSASSTSSGSWNGQAFNIALAGNGLDNAPPDTTIDSGPANPTTSTSATFTFSGSDDLTPAASLTFECSLDGASFASCTSPAAYSGLAVGSHTFRVRAIDGSGNVDPTPASFTWVIQAATSLLYNGTQIVNVGTTFQPAAKLSSSASACVPGMTASFSLDRNPLTGAAGPYPLSTAVTNSSGQATASAIGTTSWIEGVYDITASFAGTTGCLASIDDASLTVATPGTAASGGGWYTLSGTGRNNFGFAVRKTDQTCVTSCAYRGYLLFVNNGKWRLKGTLSAYSVLSTRTGAATGTGDLYWWNTSLNGGLGGWALAQRGVAFTANFYDSRKTGKYSTDSFGIRITYTPVAPQPSTLPNSTPQVLKGGDIRIWP